MSYQSTEEKCLIKVLFSESIGIGGYLKVTRKVPDMLLYLNRAATPFSDSWYYPSPSYSGTWNSRAYSPLRGASGSSSAYSSSETRTRTASGKTENREVPIM